MLYMGAVLHYGIIKIFFVGFSSAGWQCLAPIFFVFTAEYPAAVILAFKNKDSLGTNHKHIYFSEFAVSFGNVKIEEKFGSATFHVPKVVICKILAI